MPIKRFIPKIIPQWLFASGVKAVEQELKIECGEQVEFIEAAEGETSKLKSFKMKAYTGGPMNVGFRFPVIVDLAGTKVTKKSRPILRDHSPAQVVGHSTNIAITATAIDLEGVISGSGKDAKEVQESAANGFPWQASIGARVVPGSLEFVAEGEKVTVNGKTHQGPVLIARKTILGEVSFVALGADDNTSATVAAQLTDTAEAVENATLEGSRNVNFSAWLKAKGFDEATLNDAQKKYLKAQFEAEEAATDEEVEANLDENDLIASHRKSIAAEERRVGAIRLAINASHITDSDKPDLIAKAIEENWSKEKAELYVFRAERPKPAQHGGSSHSLTAAALEFALCCAHGIDEEIAAEGLDKKDCDKGTARNVRAMTSMHAMMDHVIRASGGHFNGDRGQNDFIKAYFEAERRISASSGVSTISLPGILSNVANKAMLQSYDAQDIVHPEIVKFYDHNDFKAHSRYRLTMTGGLQKLGPDGEPKSLGMAEEAYTGRVDTVAGTITLTRKMMVDNDLKSFIGLTEDLGALAALSIEEQVMIAILLAESEGFFSAGNKNLLSGADTELSLEGLQKGVNLFSSRVNKNEKPIMFRAKKLLVPMTYSAIADDLYKGDKVEVTTTADKPKVVRNRHVGLYTPIATSFLNNTDIRDSYGKALPNQSATAWYMFADPQRVPAIGVSTLGGKRQPTIESASLDWDSLGMKWAAFHDFGVDREDPMGAIKMAGA